MEDKEREIEEEKSRLETVNEEINCNCAEIEKNYDKLSRGALAGSDFTVIKDFIDYLDRTRCALVERRLSLEEKITDMKDELIELMKEMKMLETLRTKVINEMKKTANRRQQKVLDDIALRIEEKRNH